MAGTVPDRRSLFFFPRSGKRKKNKIKGSVKLPRGRGACGARFGPSFQPLFSKTIDHFRQAVKKEA